MKFLYWVDPYSQVWCRYSPTLSPAQLKGKVLLSAETPMEAIRIGKIKYSPSALTDISDFSKNKLR